MVFLSPETLLLGLITKIQMQGRYTLLLIMQQQTLIDQSPRVESVKDITLISSSSVRMESMSVGVSYLKAVLVKKVNQHQSFAFRKICMAQSFSTRLNLRDRHQHCLKSSVAKDKKIVREKSHTQRHSVSSFQLTDDVMSLSEDVKVVLNELVKTDKLGQIVDAEKRIGQIVSQEVKRLEKIKTASRPVRSKSYDTELTVICIQKLLKTVGQLAQNSEQLLGLKSQIQILQQQLSQLSKPPKDKDPSKQKLNQQTLMVKQTLKAVDTLTTIFRDHKIVNIKRKLEQQSKKFSQLRKELFDGILQSIGKAESAQQANLSQITQLSCKLLQEQPTIQKNIAHLEKNKRIVQKALAETRTQESKAAYYNLVDTAMYLIKIYSAKDSKDAGETSRIKSPPRSRKTNRDTKTINSKTSSMIKSKIIATETLVQISNFKSQASEAKQGYSVESNQFISWLGQLKQGVLQSTVLPDQQEAYYKFKSEEERQVIDSLFEIIQFSRNQTNDLKNFIETLSFEIQSLKSLEESSKSDLEAATEVRLEGINTQINQVLLNLVLTISGKCQPQRGSTLQETIKYLSEQVQSIRQQLAKKQLLHGSISSVCLLHKQRLSSIGQSECLQFPEGNLQVRPQLTQLSQLLQSYHTTIEWHYLRQKEHESTETKFQAELEEQKLTSSLDMEAKIKQIGYLKESISELSQKLLDLRSQKNTSLIQQNRIQDLQTELGLLKVEKFKTTERFQETIRHLEDSRERNHINIMALEQKLHLTNHNNQTLLQSLREQQINDRHSWEMEKDRFVVKDRELSNIKTTLESDVFILKREVEGLRLHLDKVQSSEPQEQVINSLKEENAYLRNDIIEKGQIISDFESELTQFRSAKTLKNQSTNGSLKISAETQEAFRKKNINNSSQLIKGCRPLNQEIGRLLEQKTLVQVELRQAKEKVGVMGLQRSRDENIISQLRTEVRVLQNQLQGLSIQCEELKRTENSYKEKLRQYEIEEGSAIVRKEDEWNYQLYFDSVEGCKSSVNTIQDRVSLLKVIDHLKGQLYKQGAKLVNLNIMREHDLKILISENQLLQDEVKDVNSRLIAERVKVAVSPRILEDSMKKMESQLKKLKLEGAIFRDELRGLGNPETFYVQDLNPKPPKPEYEFVTSKFNSRVRKCSDGPVSPRNQSKSSQYIRQLERENNGLVARVKLLSVFTIIDQQNKAFANNINRVINSLLQFLSTSQEFQECDYSDVDFMGTLSQYLSQQDYQGYFETLQTFFKDLFVNVFQRKNTVMSKQADQLLFLKDKMEDLLSEKIQQIQEQQEKLTQVHRTPLKNYNGNGDDKSKEQISNLQHLFKLFLKFKDPKILKEVCQVLNINDSVPPTNYDRYQYPIE